MFLLVVKEVPVFTESIFTVICSLSTNTCEWPSLDCSPFHFFIALSLFLFATIKSFTMYSLTVSFLILLMSTVATNAVATKRFIFRQDDVEDYYHNTVQKSMVDWFIDHNVGVTIGIIAGSVAGHDSVIMAMLHRCIQQSPDKCGVFNHGWDAVYHYGADPKSAADAYAHLKQADDQIKLLLPSYQVEMFVPHENDWGSYALQAVKQLGYLGISASTDDYSGMAWDLTKDPMQLPQQTTTGDWSDKKNDFVKMPIATTVADCNAAAARGEVCVIMTHPHEFANGQYTLTDLATLVSTLQANGFTSTNFHTIINEAKAASGITKSPSRSPSFKPSSAKPSLKPSVVPSVKPSTIAPSFKPSVIPTATPSVKQSTSPSEKPSVNPTVAPSAKPLTIVPSESPTVAPSAKPVTTAPSAAPTASPSVAPVLISAVPSLSPSVAPSAAPSKVPSVAPSVVASAVPSVTPTTVPSIVPSEVPSGAPVVLTEVPTALPIVSPSETPTISPSALPSEVPSSSPTASPSEAPVVITDAPTTFTMSKRFIFRQDDVEDFFHSDIQAKLLNFFMDREIGVSAGIIGDYVNGSDSQLFSALQRCVSVGSDKCALANRGTDSRYKFGSAASTAEAKAYIESCDSKIKSLFPGYGDVPVFIPYQNSWNEHTVEALRELNYPAISASEVDYSNMPWSYSTAPLQLPQQTTTAGYGNCGQCIAVPVARIVADCKAAAARGEVCVIMTHPQEFAEGIFTFRMLHQLIESLYVAGFTSTNFPTIIAEAVAARTTITPSASPSAIPTANDPTSFPTMRPSHSQTLMVPSYFPTFSPSPCPPPTVFPTVVSSTAPSASPSLAAPAVPPIVSTSSPTAATTVAPSIAPSIAPSLAPTDYAISDFKSTSAEVFSHLAHPTPYVLGGMIAAGIALLCLALYGIRYFYIRGASSSDKEVVKTSSLDGIEFIVDDSLELGSGGGSATSSLSRYQDGEKYLPGSFRKSKSFRYDEQFNHRTPSAQDIAVFDINTDASSVGSENV
jgi:hypothetical protein